MEYRIFRKTVQSKNGKLVKKYYYWYYDVQGKQVKKVCKNCTTKADAEAYIQKIQSDNKIEIKAFLISDITENMFIPGSLHYLRRQQMGKSVSKEILLEAYGYLKIINAWWGTIPITELTPNMVINTLVLDDHSASWKNRIIEYVIEIFYEAISQGSKVTVPCFQKFRRNTIPKYILTSRDISLLFKQENFESEKDFLFFLLMFSCGLRMGEIRGLKTSQVLYEKKALYINGFMKKNNIDKTSFNKTGSNDKKKHRVVLVPSSVFKLLTSWIENQSLHNDDYVFTYNSKPLRTEYADILFNKAVKKAGIEKDDKKLTPHCLRFTYVTRMNRLVSPELIMLMDGHSSEKMNDYYNHMDVDVLETISVLEKERTQIDNFITLSA